MGEGQERERERQNSFCLVCQYSISDNNHQYLVQHYSTGYYCSHRGLQFMAIGECKPQESGWLFGHPLQQPMHIGE